MAYEVIHHELFEKQLRKLRSKKATNAVKIDSYIRSLSKFGLKIIKTDKANPLKSQNETLFYLRPFPNRVIFCKLEGDTFLILHLFEKKYNGAIKQDDIQTALQRLAEWK